MYAITGITGQVGGATAHLLLEKGLPVTAVIRNPAKAAAWKDKGLAIAAAELHDVTALTAAFTGAEGVFVLTPPLFGSTDPMADHDRMLAALTQAIETAKPKKLVYLSSIGAHRPQGTGAIKKLYDMEQAFKQLPLPTAGIRAAWFMENFTGAIPSAKESGILSSFLNPTSLYIPMVATRDIGQLAAQLLTETWSGHRIIELEGPCRYAADDVASVLSYRLNKCITAQPLPPEQYAATYVSFGFTPTAAQMMAEMNNGFNSEWIVFEENGREHVSGETFLEDIFI